MEEASAMNTVCQEKESPLGAITSTISPILVSAFCSTILYKYLLLGNCGWFPRIVQSPLQKDWGLKTGALSQRYSLRRKVTTKVPELSNVREKDRLTRAQRAKV